MQDDTPKKPSLLQRAMQPLRDFFLHNLWEADLTVARPLKRLWYTTCRVVTLTFRGFLADRCTLQASALTYITLVSIVPILAITLAFCKGIGLQKKLLESIGIETRVQRVQEDDGKIRLEREYRVIDADPEEAPAETATTAPAAPSTTTAPTAPSATTAPAAPAQEPAKLPALAIYAAQKDAALEKIAEELREKLAGRCSVAVVQVQPEDEAVSKFSLKQLPAALFCDADSQEVARLEEGLTAESLLALAATPIPARPPLPAPPKSLAAQLPKPMQDGLIKIFTYVDHTNFAALGLVGILMLLFSVITSMKKLETNYNAIWCVRKFRSIPRQICEYLIVLISLPIVLFIVTTINAMLVSPAFAAKLHLTSPNAILWLHLLGRLVSILGLGCAFIFLNAFMPNTKVRAVPAIVGGLVTGLAWGAVLFAYIKWQVGLAKFNTIYGTFAVLPFFLAWLYTSWVVTLLGAELCFAIQNHHLLRIDKQVARFDAAAAHLIGLAIMQDMHRKYASDGGAWSAADFALATRIPLPEVEMALHTLVNAKLALQLAPDAPPPKSYEYLPAKSPGKLSYADVDNAFTGLDSEAALRIRRILPPAFVAFFAAHQESALAELREIPITHEFK